MRSGLSEEAQEVSTSDRDEEKGSGVSAAFLHAFIQELPKVHKEQNNNQTALAGAQLNAHVLNRGFAPLNFSKSM